MICGHHPVRQPCHTQCWIMPGSNNRMPNNPFSRFVSKNLSNTILCAQTETSKKSTRCRAEDTCGWPKCFWSPPSAASHLVATLITFLDVLQYGEIHQHI